MVNLDRDVNEMKDAIVALSSRVSALETKKTTKEPKKSKSEE